MPTTPSATSHPQAHSARWLCARRCGFRIRASTALTSDPSLQILLLPRPGLSFSPAPLTQTEIGCDFLNFCCLLAVSHSAGQYSTVMYEGTFRSMVHRCVWQDRVRMIAGVPATGGLIHKDLLMATRTPSWPLEISKMNKSVLALQELSLGVWAVNTSNSMYHLLRTCCVGDT